MTTPSGGVYFIEVEILARRNSSGIALWGGGIVDRAAIVYAVDTTDSDSCKVFLRAGDELTWIIVRGKARDLRLKLLPPVRERGPRRGGSGPLPVTGQQF